MIHLRLTKIPCPSIMTRSAGEASMTGPSNASLSALQRGKACIACRRRKVKCDGIRPTCGQCIRGHRPEDCEYTDSQVKSRTHMLEEDITRLQARIQELEHPDHTTPAVVLHNPYLSPTVPEGSSVSFDFQNFYLPSSTPSASSPGAQYLDETQRGIVLESLDKITPFADEFGFFLHIPRVRTSLEGTSSDSIPLALQNAIVLISLCLTEAQQQSSFDLTLLSTSSRQLADIMPVCGTSTRDLLHVIQTQVLLAIYLFRVGRMVEAKCYLGASASLALAFRFHHSSLSEEVLNIPGDMQSMLFDIFRTSLPHPADQIERTEALHAFWTIFTRDKCVSTVLGVPPSISQSVRITIPWPGRIQETNFYHPGVHFMNNRPGDMPQANTIQDFLDGVPSNEGDSNSMLASYAKAQVLFDKVNDLIKRYTIDSRMQETQSFRAEFARLDALVEHLQDSLQSRSFATLSSGPRRLPHQPIPYFAIHVQSMLSFVAIRLHTPFCEYYATSTAKSVAAAMRVARALQDLGHVRLQFGPIILIWINVAFVIHAEITRLRAMKTTHFSVCGEEEFVQALNIILDVLKGMVDRCPVLGLQRKLEAVLPLLEYLGPPQ